jgi:hypothetical protein
MGIDRNTEYFPQYPGPTGMVFEPVPQKTLFKGSVFFLNLEKWFQFWNAGRGTGINQKPVD